MSRRAPARRRRRSSARSPPCTYPFCDPAQPYPTVESCPRERAKEDRAVRFELHLGLCFGRPQEVHGWTAARSSLVQMLEPCRERACTRRLRPRERVDGGSPPRSPHPCELCASPPSRTTAARSRAGMIGPVCESALRADKGVPRARPASVGRTSSPPRRVRRRPRPPDPRPRSPHTASAAFEHDPRPSHTLYTTREPTTRPPPRRHLARQPSPHLAPPTRPRHLAHHRTHDHGTAPAQAPHR